MEKASFSDQTQIVLTSGFKQRKTREIKLLAINVAVKVAPYSINSIYTKKDEELRDGPFEK